MLGRMGALATRWRLILNVESGASPNALKSLEARTGVEPVCTDLQ